MIQFWCCMHWLNTFSEWSFMNSFIFWAHGHIYFFSLFRCTFKIFQHQLSDTATGAPVPLPQHSRVTQHQDYRLHQQTCWLAIFSNWQSKMRVSSQRTTSNKKAVTHFPKTKMGECQHDFCNRVFVSMLKKIKRSWLMYSNRNDSLHCFCC